MKRLVSHTDYYLKRFCIIIGLSILLTIPLYAQTSFNVPINDPVYRLLDILVAHELLTPLILAQRPFSRLYVAKLLTDARLHLEETKRMMVLIQNDEAVSNLSFVENHLNIFLSRYEQDIDQSWPDRSIRLLQNRSYNTYISSARLRRIPVENGVDHIDGVISSFDAYDRGRTIRQGLNIFLNSINTVRISPYFVFIAEPQIELSYLNNQPNQNRLTALQLHGRFGWNNIEIQVGRDHLAFGHGEFGGLLLSTNARPLDMIKINNPYPLKLPSIFKYLGPSKFTLFISNLGSEQFFPYTFFYGVKASIQPFKNLEIGATHTIIIGGNDAPDVSLFGPVFELFPIHKYGSRNIQPHSLDNSNHLFGIFDMRLFLPSLRGSTIYAEFYLEDSPVRAFYNMSNAWNQFALQLGYYLPRLTSSGSMALRAEYTHTAPWTYRHSIWKSGYTLNKRPLGSRIGPDADGGSLVWHWWPNPGISSAVRFDYEVFGGDIYAQTLNELGGFNQVVKIMDLTDESRVRLRFDSNLKQLSRWSLNLHGGIERIHNFDFKTNNVKYNLLFGSQLVLNFSGDR